MKGVTTARSDKPLRPCPLWGLSQSIAFPRTIPPPNYQAFLLKSPEISCILQTRKHSFCLHPPIVLFYHTSERSYTCLASLSHPAPPSPLHPYRVELSSLDASHTIVSKR